jgi:hypothetical protein
VVALSNDKHVTSLTVGKRYIDPENNPEFTPESHL